MFFLGDPVSYRTYCANEISESILAECSRLFSTHYGVWGSQSHAPPGQRIKMSPQAMRRQLLFNENCGVVVAVSHGSVIGHAFHTGFICNGGTSTRQLVRWITQLVVSPERRGQGIATHLLSCAIQPRKHLFAAGLVSSNPAAIRALERAVGRRTDSYELLTHSDTILAACDVPYIAHKNPTVSLEQCIIDTGFFVDHSEVNEIIASQKNNVSPDRPWCFGSLPDGHEFFAFVLIKSPSPPISASKPSVSYEST
eukprot:gene38919-47340_t